MSTADGARVRDPARRDKILAAAAELVALRGYHAVSLADIGAAAGIVGSGIYRHFGSKSAILDALLDQAVDRLLGGAAAALSSGAAPGQVLAALIGGQVEFAIGDRRLVQLYQREAHTLPEAGLRRLRRRQREYVAEWVRALTAVRPGMSGEEARARVHAAIGAIHSVASYRSGLPRDEIAGLLTGIAWACLTGC
jgi:AcrR family transcriptional regulator